jgi:hypothetical protein
VGKSEGRRPLGRTRHRWGNNIGMGFGGVGLESIDWIDLAEDRDRWQKIYFGSKHLLLKHLFLNE